jgi:hypothetical protein
VSDKSGEGRARVLETSASMNAAPQKRCTVPPKLVVSNQTPKKSVTRLMTPERHRARAAQLYQNPSPEAQHLARGHELAAKLIEHHDKTPAA